MDWLTYANQNATRNLPLSPDLVRAMSFLPELGVRMEVFSGGQPAAGGGARVGSVRHDHGNAADVFFYDQNGRRLDWSNPNDLPIFREIVRRARAAGVTGFGAGDGYMQQGSMHIGFGAPAVWGAGGRGTNAPDWLREAFGSAPAGGSARTAGQPAQTPVAAPQTAAQQPMAPVPPAWRNSLSVEPFLRAPRQANALLGYGAGNPFFGA